MNDEIQHLKCEGCGWEGDSTELSRLSNDPDDRDFNFCPNCKGANFEINGGWVDIIMAGIYPDE